MNFKPSKYVCCSLMDLTIACRIIASFGVTISLWLVTVLLNDTFWRSDDDYDLSRKTALAFGLDWQHFHENASVTHAKDPEGKMISVIVMFYSAAFLFINFLLFFGTISASWMCAIPWLLCEFLGCLSKFGALIYHWKCDHMGNLFFVGSVIYIVIMTWWWLVVFFAQQSWKHKQKWEFALEMTSMNPPSPKVNSENEEFVPTRYHIFKDFVLPNSPGPYCPNSKYAQI